MTTVAEVSSSSRARLPIRRHFTRPEGRPYEEIEWEKRTANIAAEDGSTVFEQQDVEVPKEWSQRATNVVASKYFRGPLVAAAVVHHKRGEIKREGSVRELIDRVVGTITAWGRKDGYFADERGGRCLRGGADPYHPPPEGDLQQPRLVQRRRGGEAAVLGLLHPLRRGHDGLDPRLVPDGGDDLQGRLRLGRQPVAAALVAGGALHRRARLGAGLLHARRRRHRRLDQVGRQDAAGGEDGHPQHRPPGHRRVHRVQGEGGAQGVRPGRGRLRPVARRRGVDVDPVPERQQLRAGDRRVHAGGGGRRQVDAAGGHHRSDHGDAARARPPAQDRRGGLALRRPGHAVRHDDQRLAHLPGERPHQRLEPLLRVHARRRLGVQPRLAEPDEVRRRERGVRYRVVPAGGDGDDHRPGDHRRQRRLPDGADRRERRAVPSAGHRLRQPGRSPDVARLPLRLGRRPGLRRRRHGPDDGLRLRDLRPSGGAHGAVRRIRGEPQADARRDRDAPAGGRADRRRARAGAAAEGGRQRRGTRRWRWAMPTAIATRRSPCSPPRARSPS